MNKRSLMAIAGLLALVFFFSAQTPFQGQDRAGAVSASLASISIGANHSCALTTTGGAECWGYNFSGEVGDGSAVIYRLGPTDVVGLTSGVASISAGTNSTCVVTTLGGVKCWGFNASGELGNGTTTDSNVPVDVTGLTSGVAQVSVGSGKACALTTLGGVKCWGSSVLGNGTAATSNVPVDVTGPHSGVAQIAVGSSVTCARMLATGGLKCWGLNGNGGVGNGTTTQQPHPGRRSEPDQRCRFDRCRSRPRLRRDNPWRPEVLGL